jgi:hypothetical protein
VGQCNYYLRARFRTPKDAEVARPRLAEFLAQGERAYDYWQGSRPFGGPGPSPEEFWRGFREQFPDVWRYLGNLAGTAEWNNGLAGQMSLVDPAGAAARLWREDNELFLVLRDIWHFSDLTRLEVWIRREYGALRVGSLSEEHFEFPEDGGDGEDGRWDEGWYFDAIEEAWDTHEDSR